MFVHMSYTLYNTPASVFLKDNSEHFSGWILYCASFDPICPHMNASGSNIKIKAQYQHSTFTTFNVHRLYQIFST